MPDHGQVRFEVRGAIAHITFDRPDARNAMTWSMYAALKRVCEELQKRSDVRVAIFRGAGGQAFVSGTDISQFLEFKDGEDGVRYEALIDAHVSAMETLPMPTIAVIEGLAIGGGLAMAAACDFRLSTPGARLGLPIAKTVGNCLSMANVTRLAGQIGPANLNRMLLAARLLTAEELFGTGFVEQIVAPDEIASAADALALRLAALAPITQRVSKAAIRRWAQSGRHDSGLQGPDQKDGLDLIRAAYASQDFKEGVAAFTEKRAPVWRGK